MKFTCALAGCGVRGAVWRDLLLDSSEVELTACVDPQLERASQFAFPGKGSIDALADLQDLRRPCDFVVLATPPSLHFDQVKHCLEQGLHVICEKPLVEEFEQAVQLVRFAERRQLKLMVGMNFRYLASSQHLREASRLGRLGPLSYGSLKYIRNRDGRRPDLNSYPLEMEHPMLREQSVHHLDLVRYCYDREVVRVVSDTWNPSASVYRKDSCVSVLLELEDGARVNYLGSWTAGWNGMEFHWRSDFRDGAIWQRGQFGKVAEARLDPELALTGPRFRSDVEAETVRQVPLPRHRPFIDDTRGLLAEFIGSLRSGEPLFTSARDHLGTLAILEACVQSIRESAWTRVENVFFDHGAGDLILRNSH